MSPKGPAADQGELLARLHETIELLESIAADHTILAGVPDEDRKRLLQAVANVYSPDRVERRRMSKVVARERKAARVRRDQGVLHETGIRSLRRKPVFHTPNVFPTVSIADGFDPRDVSRSMGAPAQTPVDMSAYTDHARMRAEPIAPAAPLAVDRSVAPRMSIPRRSIVDLPLAAGAGAAPVGGFSMAAPARPCNVHR